MNTVIRDEVMEPYYITVDPYNYNLAIAIKPQKENSPENSKVKEYEKIMGHYSSLGLLIKKLAKLKANDKGSYNSIKEYLDEYKKQEKIINNLIENI